VETLRSEQWSNAHLAVNDRLSDLLNALRDLGYNPSLHLSYDRAEHHLALDATLLAEHPAMQSAFDAYREACKIRDVALDAIQSMPKLDIGF